MSTFRLLSLPASATILLQINVCDNYVSNAGQMLCEFNELTTTFFAVLCKFWQTCGSACARH